MNKYRVDLSVTIDVEANDETHAEVIALEYFDQPNMEVIEVIQLDKTVQGELFD